MWVHPWTRYCALPYGIRTKKQKYCRRLDRIYAPSKGHGCWINTQCERFFVLPARCRNKSSRLICAESHNCVRRRRLRVLDLLDPSNHDLLLCGHNNRTIGRKVENIESTCAVSHICSHLSAIAFDPEPHVCCTVLCTWIVPSKN